MFARNIANARRGFVSIEALKHFSLVGLACALLCSCAMVHVNTLRPDEYLAKERGDVLTTGTLSNATIQVLRVTDLDQRRCSKSARDCIGALSKSTSISSERRLAAIAELWLLDAISYEKSKDDAALDSWFEVARHAYAYLFFTDRKPSERAFEERQIQISDYYDYAAEKIISILYRRRTTDGGVGGIRSAFEANGWHIRMDMAGVRLPDGVLLPRGLIPASSLEFSGLRSTYRRDGIGADLVAIMEDDPITSNATSPEKKVAPIFSEMPSPALTVLTYFRGESLSEVLSTREVVLSVHDPYRVAAVDIHGQRVPVSADFTSGYALWLAQSRFSKQAIYTLLGRRHGIERPHVYLMQPFDPERRVLLMLHGLASSPEAWVNVVNEISGDEALREKFQIWLMYYPTNAPLAYNQFTIRDAIGKTLRHFDPEGTGQASRNMVLVGHSMGGVLARLLVSSSGDRLWNEVREEYGITDEQGKMRARLDPMLRFEPMPQVNRAIFIAAPHRGTKVARKGIVRWLASALIKLPSTLMTSFQDVISQLAANKRKIDPGRVIPNSVDNLSESNPFVQAASDLPMALGLRYHSIIARRDPEVPLEESDDGLVPYASSHLAGALSEKVITSGHSVQETTTAITEVRRVLHEDIAALSAVGQ